MTPHLLILIAALAPAPTAATFLADDVRVWRSSTDPRPIPEALPRVVELLREAQREPGSGSDVGLRLRELGPEAVPALFAVLNGRGSEVDTERRGVLLDRTTEPLVIDALRAHPPREVIARLRAVLAEEGTPPTERVVALRVVGEVGGAGEAHELLRLLAEIDPVLLGSTTVARQLDRSLRALLGRERRAWIELERALESSAAVLVLPVLDAVVRLGEGEGAALLERMARHGEEHLRVALRAPARLDPRALAASSERCRGLARPQLFAEAGETRLLAAQSLGHLRDGESASELILLLEDREARVRQSAHQALRRISGLDLPAQPQRWSAWLESERQWEAQRLERSARNLDTRETSEALEALRELAAHPLYRERTAPLVAQALAHRHDQVAEAACSTLAQLGAVELLPQLVEVLGSKRRPNVRAAAHRGLLALSNARLSEDAQAWRRWLEE